MITKSKHFAITTILLLCTATAPAAKDTTSLVTANNAFALDLYARLKSADGNLFFSPYSISTCLAVAYTGARGDTAKQMARTLHFPLGPTELTGPFAALQSQLNLLQQNKTVELNVANALWTQQGHPFLPAFLAAARDSFAAHLNQTDFRTSAEPPRKQNNDFDIEQTKAKITDLLAPGVLTPDTRLAIVNAIYFKGRWVDPFQKRATADAPFHITAAQPVTAHFMHHDAYFKYAEPAGCQILELPYATGEPGTPPGSDHLSMVVLLPHEVDGLKKLEASLSEPALKDWLTQAHQQKVNVTLPKFKTTAQFSLGETLDTMGMTDAFSDHANFSGMDGDRDLYISAVIHKAYVDVNEEGTEAAAATAVGVALTSAMPRPSPVFRADHPFIFLIRDTQSGSILFLGRLADPTKN